VHQREDLDDGDKVVLRSVGPNDIGMAPPEELDHVRSGRQVGGSCMACCAATLFSNPSARSCPSRIFSRTAALGKAYMRHPEFMFEITSIEKREH
jgi:hypothetical protein